MTVITNSTHGTSVRAAPALMGQFDVRWNGKSIHKTHWHFHQALYARYGVVLGPGEFSQMIKDIRSGRALKVRQLSEQKAVHFVRLQRVGERCFILVEKGHIVTALPPNKGLTRARKQLDR